MTKRAKPITVHQNVLSRLRFTKIIAGNIFILVSSNDSRVTHFELLDKIKLRTLLIYIAVLIVQVLFNKKL